MVMGVAYSPDGARLATAFGEVRMPDESVAAFGNARYRTTEPGEPLLRVKVNAVFGSCLVLLGESHAPKPGAISAVMP